MALRRDDGTTNQTSDFLFKVEDLRLLHIALEEEVQGVTKVG
jgi:hypothetical protein